MIAKLGPRRKSGRGSFSDLRQYLERDDLGNERPDLVATWSGNVASHTTADLEMQRLAVQGRVTDPVYHVILSWRPGEAIEPEAARGAIDATLRSLDADSHQWFSALHCDEADGRTHLHLAINKVDPLTLNALNRWNDHAKLARAAEWVEREYGCLVDRRMPWREKLPEIDLGLSLGEAEEYLSRSLPEGIRVAPAGAAREEMDAARRAGYSWVTLLSREAAPAVHEVSERVGATWSDVHAVLETYGAHCVRAGAGLRVLGPEIGQHVKASRIGLAFEELAKKLGPFQPSSTIHGDDRLGEVRKVLANAVSWKQLHDDLSRFDFAIEQRGRGGRLCDLEVGSGSLPLGRLGASMPRLEHRLGTYEKSQIIEARAQRELQRSIDGVSERLAIVEGAPQSLIDRISSHHAVWNDQDLTSELARLVGVDRATLRETYAAQSSRAIAAAVAECQVIDEDGEQMWMTTEVISHEESQAWEALDALASRGRKVELRHPSTELDRQQRAAYDYLSEGSSDLRIVTGIGGAGKSRLLRDVCAAHRAHGDRVVGIAVAGSAALVLGQEADIETQTVAKLLHDLGRGQGMLDARTVVVVDEASMVGTRDAGMLAEHVRKAGARLYMLGDTQQHEAVARGPLLSDMVDRFGAADLSETRRAREQWLRDVGVDLRAGRITRALGALRRAGAVAEHETTDEAMVSLVERYNHDIRAGKSAVLIATKRKDVAALNLLARMKLNDRLGESHEYSTAYGLREIAVGERIVTREPDRSTGSVNGDTWEVRRHAVGDQIELRRERDGATVLWNAQERPAFDYAYAITSYRSQGQTVDASYVLVTQADAKRGIYVDVTRARETVLIAYGRDDVTDFGRLLDIGARERSKHTLIGLKRFLDGRRVSNESEKEKMTQEQAEIIISGADAKPWSNRSSELAEFRAELARHQLSYRWKIVIEDDRVVLQNRFAEIIDFGDRIVYRQTGVPDVESVADLVALRKWDEIDVDGDESLRADLLHETESRIVQDTNMSLEQKQVGGHDISAEVGDNGPRHRIRRGI